MILSFSSIYSQNVANLILKLMIGRLELLMNLFLLDSLKRGSLIKSESDNLCCCKSLSSLSSPNWPSCPSEKALPRLGSAPRLICWRLLDFMTLLNTRTMKTTRARIPKKLTVSNTNVFVFWLEGMKTWRFILRSLFLENGSVSVLFILHSLWFWKWNK